MAATRTSCCHAAPRACRHGRPRHRRVSAAAVAAQSGAARAFQRGSRRRDTFAPNAFVRVAPDDTVTVLSKHIEFGQGPFTGLATLVAEEMDADWSQVRAEHAPSESPSSTRTSRSACRAPAARRHRQFLRADAQGRRCSARHAGAAPRPRHWGVPAAQITVENGVIRHARPARGHVRRVRRRGRGAAGAEERAAEGSVEVHAHRPRRQRDARRQRRASPTAPRSSPSTSASRRCSRCVVARPPRFGGKVASVR